jgi:ribosomal protein S18 acetylase RimI-like enzyme
MTTRPVQSTDVAPCATLFADVFSNPPWNETWTSETAERRLRDCAATPHFIGVLAESAEGIGGFAFGYLQQYMNEQHYYLLELCVDTRRQRQGLGGALITALNTRIQAAGASRIYTLTARDTAAQRFYEKAGFYLSPKMVLMARRFS